MNNRSVIVRGCTSLNELYELSNINTFNNQNEYFKMCFFYNPPDDFQIYHITCEISNDNISQLLSDHTFHHQLNEKTSYKISCILISPSLIVQFLNKNIYGIEPGQDENPQQEWLTFYNSQRENLEFHLKQFLGYRST